MDNSTTGHYADHHSLHAGDTSKPLISRILASKSPSLLRTDSAAVCGGGGQILFLVEAGITRLLCLLLVLIFVIAAANKASNFTNFVNDVSSQGIIHNQLVPVLSALLILFEFVLPGWLLLSILNNNSLHLPIIAMSSTFLFFIGYAFLMANKPDTIPVSNSCGCGLPSVLESTTGVWQGVMMRNGIFIGIAVVTLFLDWLSRHEKKVTFVADHQLCEELS